MRAPPSNLTPRVLAPQSLRAADGTDLSRTLNELFKALEGLVARIGRLLDEAKAKTGSPPPPSRDASDFTAAPPASTGSTSVAPPSTPPVSPEPPALPDDFVDRPGHNGPVEPPPPPPPPDDPFPGKQDEALKSAIRAYTTNGKQTISYDRARVVIFSDLDVKDGKVRCVYTHREISGGRVPSSSDMNVEHTWPQSKGATGAAKSDLHHLYPTDSKANSTRGNWPFGIVTEVKWSSPSGAKFGKDAQGRTVFEPPDEHKGNVARSLFYFSATYNKRIDASEEAALKAWNDLDPVDAAEVDRNTRIEAIQKTRNPFVDHPDLADRIADF